VGQESTRSGNDGNEATKKWGLTQVKREKGSFKEDKTNGGSLTNREKKRNAMSKFKKADVVTDAMSYETKGENKVAEKRKTQKKNTYIDPMIGCLDTQLTAKVKDSKYEGGLKKNLIRGRGLEDKEAEILEFRKKSKN